MHPQLDIDIVQEAMDQHAKNMAVAFSRWQKENEYYRGDNDHWYRKDGEGIAASTSQLYNFFIQQLLTNKQ
jgi:hypothetical protein